MAKFCTKCGKPLEDGKVCDCQSATTVKVSNGKETAKSYWNLFVEVVKGIFTKPVDTMKKYATKENFVFALIVLLVNAIVTGVLVYCTAKESTNVFGSVMGYGSMFTSTIEVPFLKTVLLGTLFSVVNFAVTAAMIYVMVGMVFKSNMDFKKAVALTGVCSVFGLIATLVSIVCVFISMKLATLVLLISGMFYLMYLYQGIGEISKIDKNKMAYAFIPSIVVATFVVTYILPKILF